MTNRHLLTSGAVLFLSALFIVPVNAQKRETLTTVIIVRHAEKDTAGTDPALTERGLERAKALDRTLADNRITAIYVTQYLRTRQTAQVVADREKVKPTVFRVDLSKPTESGKAIAREILRKHRGETILVSDHSNIIPFIIDALGGGWIGNLDERFYDNLFIVVRSASGGTKLLRLKYGAPSN